jgi:hypothetical protein
MSSGFVIELVPGDNGRWQKISMPLEEEEEDYYHPMTIQRQGGQQSSSSSSPFASACRSAASSSPVILREMHTYGHPAHLSHQPIWFDDEEEEEEEEEEEDSCDDGRREMMHQQEADDHRGMMDGMPVEFGHCHKIADNDDELSHKEKYHQIMMMKHQKELDHLKREKMMKKYHNPNTIIDEAWLSPRELEILRRKQRKATMIRTGTTAGGALVGVLAGGPFGGAIGGAAGSLIGEAISPVPNRRRTTGKTVKDAFWGAVGGGLSPLIFGGALAPWAATIGGGWAGKANSS